MASGENLYSGDMFQAMIEKLDETIEALHNVNTAVSQGVTSLNVKPGTDKVIVFNHGDKAFSGALGVKSTVLRFRASCSGVVTFKCNIKTSQNLNGGLYYQVNSAADVTVVENLSPANTWVEKIFAVPVMNGDIINIKILSNNASITVTLKDGTEVSYSVFDVVNEGAVIII